MNALTEPQKYTFPDKIKNACLACIAVGLISFLIGLAVDPQRSWANFLLGSFYWFSVALGGGFFVAIQHVTGAAWSIPIRRIPEVFVAFLPWAFGFFLVLLLASHNLYEWTHAGVVAEDHILQLKQPYLNLPFMIFRTLLTFGLGIFGGRWLLNNSLAQDLSGAPELSVKNMRISALYIVLFAWFYSFSSFDWIMSLAPHWFSTIFGVYCFSGLFYSALAMISVFIYRIDERGLFGAYVTKEHYHGMGKLMFGFVVFWGYIAFSQFMLIWYANLPEETPYMITRVTGSWESISYLLLAAKFGVPFFFLITQMQKRTKKWMLAMAVWMLLAHWIDLYWLIFPNFPQFVESPPFGWMEVGIFAGFSGLFIFTVCRKLSQVALVPFRDPWVEEGVHHHQ